MKSAQRWSPLLPGLLLVSSVLPTAIAQAVEVPLPAGAANPLALRFDEGGTLWVTLDGTWGLARINLSTDRIDLARFDAARSNETDSLFDIQVAPDGSLWTGSQTHLHRVDPVSLQPTSYPLPTPTKLSGGVFLAGDGKVWYSLVTADRLVRLDPATGTYDTKILSTSPSGPLLFDSMAGETYLTLTYARTYAHFDPATGDLRHGPDQILQAPVGIAHDANSLWVAEMGADTVTRIDPSTGARERFPTTPSPFYYYSGPSGVLVARDGMVWFAEHFADRIARLDPVNRTLHEFPMPSAPGTNVQNVAEAPDGTIWFAEWSNNKIGWVSPVMKRPEIALPSSVTVRPGETLRVPLPTSLPLVFGVGESGLNLTWADGALEIRGGSAKPGEHNVLVSQKEDAVLAGRYVTVVVPGKEAPSVPFLLLGAAVLVAVALWRRR